MKQSQKLLLTWLIEDPRLFGAIKGLITAEDFTEELYHRVATELFAQYEADGSVNPAQIISRFPEADEQKEIAGLRHLSESCCCLRWSLLSAHPEQLPYDLMH